MLKKMLFMLCFLAAGISYGQTTMTAEELIRRYNAGERNFERAELSGANLSGANLSGANLSRADLTNANLNEANLEGAILNSTFLSGALLNRANLNRAGLLQADLRSTDLRGADLREADLRRAELREADLSDANLSGAKLDGAIIRAGNLSRANLSGAILIGANLSFANLIGANLIGANLSGASLKAAKLSGANLRRTNLSEADLRGVNLVGLDLNGVDLRAANLSVADLSGTNLSGANLSGTNLSGTLFASQEEINAIPSGYIGTPFFIAATNENTPAAGEITCGGIRYKKTATNDVQEFKNDAWRTVGLDVSEISCTDQGELKVIYKGIPLYFLGEPDAWSESAFTMSNISKRVACNGKYFIMGANTNVYEWYHGTWRSIGSGVTEISCTGQGELKVMHQGSPLYFLGEPDAWSESAFTMSNISKRVACNGKYFIMGANTNVYEWYQGTWREIGRGVTDIGCDGSTFTCDHNGRTLRYQGNPDEWQ